MTIPLNQTRLWALSDIQSAPEVGNQCQRRHVLQKNMVKQQILRYSEHLSTCFGGVKVFVMMFTSLLDSILCTLCQP